MKIEYEVMNTPEYCKIRKEYLKKMKEVRSEKKINTSRDYLILANKIAKQHRIISRNRINKIIIEKAEKLCD